MILMIVSATFSVIDDALRCSVLARSTAPSNIHDAERFTSSIPLVKRRVLQGATQRRDARFEPRMMKKNG